MNATLFFITISKYALITYGAACTHFGANPVEYLHLLSNFFTLWDFSTLTYCIFKKSAQTMKAIVQQCEAMEAKTIWKLQGKDAKVHIYLNIDQSTQ